MERTLNKEAASTFLRMVLAGKIREAYGKFVAPDFKHHNAYFAGDRQSLMLAMEEAHLLQPNKEFEIKHSVAEGDMVAVHSHLRPKPGEPGMAVLHLFRFHDGKIVELWDLGQPIPKDLPNQNGMF
jgi:predicted SnoaL-like aldol condensation-catalyzing enzyme